MEIKGFRNTSLGFLQVTIVVDWNALFSAEIATFTLKPILDAKLASIL